MGLDVTEEEEEEVVGCVEINQRRVHPSSGEEPALPRHRASAASMAWRSTRTRRKFLIFTQVVGDAKTERLLRGSPKKKALVKLPSFRSSSSQEEEEAAHDKKKGPFHGMTKKVVNLAANKAGKAPAKLMLKLGATASMSANLATCSTGRTRPRPWGSCS